MFLFGKMAGQITELKIFYLFMKADGNVAPEEDERFKTILKEMDVNEETRDYALKDLETFIVEPNRDNSVEVCDKIGEIMDDPSLSFLSELDKDKKEQYFTVWTLINLGYADKEFTKPEKRVVEFLIKRWNIEPVVAAEMFDTAETMLALTKEKEWVKTTNKSFDQMCAVIEKIDEDIMRMFNHMKATISEAEIAISD